MRYVTPLAVLLAVVGAGWIDAARSGAAGNPIATPTGMVRYYLHALGRGQCALASKFGRESSRSLSAFQRDCRSIRRIAIDRLDDPGYRLRPQAAAYTCLAIRYRTYRRDGMTLTGGWYLMERTLGPAWSILFTRSHVTTNGRAIHLTKAQCAGHLPPYVRRGSGTIVAGSDFLSATTGWVALSTSGSYVANGSCDHGIGSNCESASTTLYRIDSAGGTWRALIRFATTIGPPVWIRLFSRQVGLVAATVGPLTATSGARFSSALFSTRDSGRHWRRFPLPPGYVTETGTVSFPDPRHGWLWYGGAAAGSMAVDVYRTQDGGRHWLHVACTTFPGVPLRSRCLHPSGIGLGGDKQYLTFKDDSNGWLTVFEDSGVPDIYRTADGGRSWRRQPIGLPAGVALPSGKTDRSTVFPGGELLQPSFAGRMGLLAEEVSFYRSRPRANWSRLFIYRSMDGGRNWCAAVRTPVSGGNVLWQALDARRWTVISTASDGSGQWVWSTENGGAPWSRQALRLPAGLTLVGFNLIDRRDGWGTAQPRADPQGSVSGRVLVRTADGGVTWTAVAGSPAGSPAASAQTGKEVVFGERRGHRAAHPDVRLGADEVGEE